MPNQLPVDIPPSSEPYYGVAQYSGPAGPQVQLNPGPQVYGGTDYSQVNWNGLQQSYPAPGSGGYTAPSQTIYGNGPQSSYSPPISGFFGHTPFGQLINGGYAISQGHFMDGTPIGRLLGSLGHLAGGSLGQHSADVLNGDQQSQSQPSPDWRENAASNHGSLNGMTAHMLGTPYGEIGGLPDYGTNFANYPANWLYGGPQTGNNAPGYGSITGGVNGEPVYRGGQVLPDSQTGWQASGGNPYADAQRGANPSGFGKLPVIGSAGYLSSMAAHGLLNPNWLIT